MSSVCRSESLVSSFIHSPRPFPGKQAQPVSPDFIQRELVLSERLAESRSPAAGGKCHSQVLSESFLLAMRKALWKEKVGFLWLWFLGRSADVLVSWHSEHEPGFRSGLGSCCLPSHRITESLTHWLLLAPACTERSQSQGGDYAGFALSCWVVKCVCLSWWISLHPFSSPLWTCSTGSRHRNREKLFKQHFFWLVQPCHLSWECSWSCWRLSMHTWYTLAQHQFSH